MKKLLTVLLVVGVFLIAGVASAQAQEETNKTITSIGTNIDVGASWGYFRVDGDFALNCMYKAVYYDVSTDFGKNAQSILLAAKTAGVNLSRIKYNQDVDNLCYLALIEYE